MSVEETCVSSKKNLAETFNAIMEYGGSELLEFIERKMSFKEKPSVS